MEFIFKPFATRKRRKPVTTEGLGNGLPRGVSLADRAASLFRTPFGTGCRHFACRFSLINGAIT